MQDEKGAADHPRAAMGIEQIRIALSGSVLCSWKEQFIM